MTTRMLASLALTGLALSPALQAQSFQETRSPELAQAPPRQVEDVLPATSYASIQFSGLSAFSAAAENIKITALGRDVLEKMDEAFYERHLGRRLERFTTRLRNDLERVGMDPSALHGVLQRPMALGIGRLTIEGLGNSVALVIDAGGARDEIDNVMVALQRLGAEHGFEVSEQDLHGHRMRMHRREGMPPVFAGYLGDLFVVTNSRGYFGDIAAVVAGRQPGLSAGSYLGQARANLPEPALLSCYLNTQTLTSMFDQHLPYEAPEWGRALGLSGLSGIYMGMSGAGHGTSEIVHVGMTGESSGLLKTAVKGPVSLSPARYCSSDTAAFAAFSLDVPAAIDAFDRFLDLLPADLGEKVRRRIEREMARGLRRSGTDAESLDELVRAFGSNAAVALNLPGVGLPVPELLGFVEVDDYQQVSRFLGRMQTMIAEETGTTWRSRAVGETEIHYCSVSIPDSPIGLSPCYAWHDGYLILSTHVRNLRAALAQAQDAENSLMSEPDFRKLAAEGGDASALLHLRYLRGVELTWRTIETWVGPRLEAMRDKIGFGSEVLPEGEVLSEALGTATYSLHVDDSGILLRERADVGFGTLLVTAGALADHLFGKVAAKVY